MDLLTLGTESLPRSDRKWAWKSQIPTGAHSCFRKAEVPSKLLIISPIHVEERLFIAPHCGDYCISSVLGFKIILFPLVNSQQLIEQEQRSDTTRTKLFLVILYSQTDEGSHRKMGRSPQDPSPQGADGGRGEISVCGGLALTRRLLLVEPKQGAQLLFWSNSTNWGYISQHKRVRKPFCYCKKLKSLLRIAQLIFSDLVLSNIVSVFYGDSANFYATAT